MRSTSLQSVGAVSNSNARDFSGNPELRRPHCKNNRSGARCPGQVDSVTPQNPDVALHVPSAHVRRCDAGLNRTLSAAPCVSGVRIEPSLERSRRRWAGVLRTRSCGTLPEVALGASCAAVRLPSHWCLRAKWLSPVRREHPVPVSLAPRGAPTRVRPSEDHRQAALLLRRSRRRPR